MTTTRDKATEVLASHDALVATQETEPGLGPDGLPKNPEAWIRWRDEVNAPAYARWSAAMDALAQALGEPDMSRHPMNFRPRCEALISSN